MDRLMAEAGRGRQRPRVWTALVAIAVAGCSTVVPRTAPPPPPVAAAPPPAATTPGRLQDTTPRDRVAVLVPLTGPNAAVGASIANAANMAVIDTGGRDIRVTTYDTGAGAAQAASRAIAEGNGLILGPLLGEDVRQVAPIAAQARVPVVAFSNDTDVAGHGVYLLGYTPGQSIGRVVGYAAGRGLRRIAALVPSGVYGRRASNALLRAAEGSGSTVIAMQGYERSPASIAAAVRKLGDPKGYDAVLIADSGRIALIAAPLVRRGGSPARLLGTELWNTEPQLAAARVMNGAWFAAVPDRLYARFAAGYRARFGKAPYRLATLGYDGVLLAGRIAADWKPGSAFPVRRLTDRGGFAGIDGAFRFDEDGIAERTLDVKQVGQGTVTVISPATGGFGG